MKHLMTFESFVDQNNNDVNEWLGQKFITGHDKGEKEIAKKKIEEDIEKAFSEVQSRIEKEPTLEQMFPQFKNLGAQKVTLLQKAKENNYKGSVHMQKSPEGKIYIVYREGQSGLQHLGAGAGAATSAYVGHGRSV